LEAVAKALFAQQDQVGPKGMGRGAIDGLIRWLGLGSGSGGHQSKGFAIALQAHEQLAVGPKVGLAIRGVQWNLVGQAPMEPQGFVKLIEVPQAAGKAAQADGAVGLKG
jgi:hypothetical protein